MRKHLQGIIAPILTPYKTDHSINYLELKKITVFLLDNGADGIFVSGTSGEFVNLTIDERIKILDCVNEVIPSEKTILFNVTAMNKEDILRMINHAHDIGVKNISVTAPYYHKYDQKALYEYFMEIDRMSDGLNLYLYNMESLTGNPITPELLKNVYENSKNIKGIKDSSMDFMRFLEYQINIPTDNFEVVTGNDGQILSALQANGKGALVVFASVYPELCKRIYVEYHQGNIEVAREIQNIIIGLRKICREIMPISSHKYLLSLRGFNIEKSRFPIRDLTEDEKKKLKEFHYRITINSYKMEE